MKDQPIVRSRLDDDFYKFTMGQFIWRHHRDLPVAFEFTNRTRKVRLADEIDVGELREQLAHVRSLSFKDEEIDYLRGLPRLNSRDPLFCESYLQFLKGIRLPELEIAVREGNLEIRAWGKWSEASFWEIPVLAIVNELRTRKQMIAGETLRECCAYMTFIKKMEVLKRTNVRFADFGTRRRFSRAWQERLDRELARELPSQFIGTSNVANAMKFGIKSIGTMAHELLMALAALAGDDDVLLADAPYQVMRDWRVMYGSDLSIGLPDTFGSRSFLYRLPDDMRRDWKGFRQDSGYPDEFADDLLRAYERQGVDAREKVIVFSDGLQLEDILRLQNAYRDKIQSVFGWGTNLTFDWPGIKPVSIVMKLAEVNGRRTVKLSDNPAKAMGPADEVARYKRVFNYDQTEHPTVECKV